MKAEKIAKLSIAEYLSLEIENDMRYEYHDGRVFAHAGGTMNHSVLCSAINGKLWAQLEEKNSNCFTANSEHRLFIQSKNSFVYPDAMVICGEIEIAPNEKNSATNPTLIVEVLSKSSVAYDRGDKFTFYRQLSTLQEYVLIEQDKASVDVYYKKKGTDLWSISNYQDINEFIHFKSIDVKINLGELYQRVKFPEK